MHVSTTLTAPDEPGTSKPKVALLLATYNGSFFIDKQMKSLLAQEGVDICLFCADDHSSDQTAEVVVRYSDRIKIDIVRREKSTGSAGANFRALFRDVDISGFDYVALVDQDDIWAPQKLAEAIAALVQHDADGYSGAVDSFWPDGGRKRVAQNPRTRACDFLFEGAGQGCTFVVRVQLFRLVQQFVRQHVSLADSLHYHDWLIYLVARSHGKRWRFDERAWIAYRQHAANEIGSRGGWSGMTSRLKKIRNGWYGAQIASAIGIYRAIDPADMQVKNMQRLYSRPDSLGRRFRLAWVSALYGRRRASDRVVVMFSALAGWI